MSRGRKGRIQTSGLGPAVERLRRGGASIPEIARALDVTVSMVKTHLRGVDLEDPRATLAARQADAGPVFATASDLFRFALGEEPMSHQVQLMEETRDTCLVKGRQVGASTAVGVLAVHIARTVPQSDVVVVSWSAKQSSEIVKRARDIFDVLGEKLRQDSTSLLRTDFGSRIISLPGSSRAIRGYAPRLLVLDEAAYIPEDTWLAARPMVAATGGRTIIQSTPAGPFGYFYDIASGNPEWLHMTVRSDEARTITAERLAKYRGETSEDQYAQEFEAVFTAPGLGLVDPERLDELTRERLADEEQEKSPWKRMQETQGGERTDAEAAGA
jgi:hypothetical protein